MDEWTDTWSFYLVYSMTDGSLWNSKLFGHQHSLKYLLLCSKEKTKSDRFGMTWQGVKNKRVLIFQRTLCLNTTLLNLRSHPVWRVSLCSHCLVYWPLLCTSSSEFVYASAPVRPSAGPLSRTLCGTRGLRFPSEGWGVCDEASAWCLAPRLRYPGHPETWWTRTPLATGGFDE